MSGLLEGVTKNFLIDPNSPFQSFTLIQRRNVAHLLANVSIQQKGITPACGRSTTLFPSPKPPRYE